LAQSEPDRGFVLLEKLSKRPHETDIWVPVGYHRNNKFWKVLHQADRKRAVRLFLSLAIGDPEEIIDQEADADVLISLALENETQAKLVSENITSGQPGFWPIAFKILL
jgi:hypothetical protein